MVLGLMLVVCCVCSSSSGAAYSYFLMSKNDEDNDEDDDQSGGRDRNFWDNLFPGLGAVMPDFLGGAGLKFDGKNASFDGPFGSGWSAGQDGVDARGILGSGASYNEDGGLTFDAPVNMGSVTVGGDSGTGFDTPVGGINVGSDGHVRVDTVFGNIKI
tara:strand:+ start:124 stop:597 length:474 start_codon:yes stop_codon:yes gene_type:complete